jgi:hypothetical protein
MIYKYRYIPFPCEGDLVIASLDSSVRIWERKTDQLVGDPSLRDDIFLVLVMYGDRTCVISIELSVKVFVWSLDGVHLRSMVWKKLTACYFVFLSTTDLTLLGSHSSIRRRA